MSIKWVWKCMHFYASRMTLECQDDRKEQFGVVRLIQPPIHVLTSFFFKICVFYSIDLYISSIVSTCYKTHTHLLSVDLGY